MNWWCASSREPWTWSWSPYLGALIIVLSMFGVALWWSVRGRHAPWVRSTPEQWIEDAEANGREVHTMVAGSPRGRSISLVLGTLGLWLVLD